MEHILQSHAQSRETCGVYYKRPNMHEIPRSAEEEFWVIWNGTHGILDTVEIGQVEVGASGRNAWLEEPYDMVGPFSLEELETRGVISFAACIVMSRQKWQEDQVELRLEARKNRRAAQERLFEFNARYSNRRSHWQGPAPVRQDSERKYRALLNLPSEGSLASAQIKTAYRRLAQKAHPDAGGNKETFVQITEARDALLEYAS